jgi:hypothetical protein
MSSEIKIVYAEVEKGLLTLQSATETISTSFAELIGGEVSMRGEL